VSVTNPTLIVFAGAPPLGVLPQAAMKTASIKPIPMLSKRIGACLMRSPLQSDRPSSAGL